MFSKRSYEKIVMTRAMAGYVIVALVLLYSETFIGIFTASFDLERYKLNFKPKSFH